MSEEQSAGELMVFGLIEQADRLAKSASITQGTLGKQIEELVSMEARVKAAVQSIHTAVKAIDTERGKLEAERKNLAAVSPTLQQNAVWAVREAIREQGGQIGVEIRREVREGMLQPLKDIQAGAGHVRQNVQETKWLTFGLVFLTGAVLGLGLGYVPVRQSILHLEEHVTAIDQYLGAQQQAAAAAAAGPAPAQGAKKKSK